MANGNTVIVTSAGGSIGRAVVQAFLDRGDNAVASSRRSDIDFAQFPKLRFVDEDIGQQSMAQQIAGVAVGEFGAIDHVEQGRHFCRQALCRVHR